MVLRFRRLSSVLIAVAFLCVYSEAQCDGSPYREKREIKASKGTLTFYHWHDWASPKLNSLFKDVVKHERFFSEGNDFSFVELKEGSEVLFRSASPALSYLWISPDSQFVVGLSDVMLDNPYQLVVWKRDGTLIHREHISAQVARLSPEQARFIQRFGSRGAFRALFHAQGDHLPGLLSSINRHRGRSLGLSLSAPGDPSLL